MRCAGRSDCTAPARPPLRGRNRHLDPEPGVDLPRPGQRSGHHQWARFLVVNLGGFVLNRGTYALLVTFVALCAEQPVYAVGAGAIAGMFVNFSLNRPWFSADTTKTMPAPFTGGLAALGWRPCIFSLPD